MIVLGPLLLLLGGPYCAVGRLVGHLLLAAAPVTASGFCCFSARHRTKLIKSAGSKQAPRRERAAVSVVSQSS